MWYTEMIGEVHVYWFLMSRGGDDLYGIAAQEGTMYSGTMFKELYKRVKAGKTCTKPFGFKLDYTEDKKKTIERAFSKWSK